jgi:hypothetical protein
LYESVFTLIRQGQAKDAVSVLREHPPKNDTERRQVIDSAQRVLTEAGESLDQPERAVLQQISSEAFGESYFDRLRRWVGPRTHTDYDLAGGSGFEKADSTTQALAEEGFTNGISEEQIVWLASEDAQNVWLFGKRLGELDKSRRFLNQIVAATPANVNCMFCRRT